MKTVGIICEYNPFHNGHEYLLKQAKSEGYAAVAVMSGNYTQRGELAVADKFTRAEAAVKCGADLVLELPFPYALASAEFFARGGISVLERIGADAICFGSESGDIGLIRSAAQAAASEEFARIIENSAREDGSAASYFDALGKVLGENAEILSNDILGIEYVKEIDRRGLNIVPIAVKRIGDRYRDEKIGSEFASATAIRKILFADGREEAEKYLPSASLDLLMSVVERGDAPADAKNIEKAILGFWRTADPSRLASVAELGNGLEYRLKDAALLSASLEELEANAATKKYTAARIRRALLFAMLGVTKADLDAEPEYTSVLAANKRGREILAELRRGEGELRIVTKAADAPKCRQQELSERADALYTLAMPTPRDAGYLTRKKIYIE